VAECRGGWNRGLTKDTDARIAAYAQAMVGHATSARVSEFFKKNFKLGHAPAARAKAGKTFRATIARGDYKIWCTGKKLGPRTLEVRRKISESKMGHKTSAHTRKLCLWL
jgi:hypothetical protein